MSINAQTTLRRLVWELEQWANAHDMIEQFGYGKYLEVYASQTNNTYPAFIVNCPSFTMDEWYFNFTIEVITLDWVFDNRENHDRATSNTAELVRDLYNTIKVSKRWQAFARLDTDWNGRHIDEFGGDKAFGWSSTFIIKIKKRSGICQLETLMPEYDFENQGTIIPTCDPVDLTFNGNAITSTPSGGTKTIIVQNDASTPAQVGTAILDNTGNLTVSVPAASVCADATVENSDLSYSNTVASGGTLVLPDVTNTDSDGSPVTVPAQTPFICTPAATPLNTANQVKTGDTSDGDRGRSRTVLSGNNPFGNTNAQTDTLGTQLYANNVVIDWNQADQVNETVLAIYRTVQSGMDYAAHVTNAAGLTIDGKTGWDLINMNEICTLLNRPSNNPNDYLNYSPYNIVTSAQGDRIFTKTKADIPTRAVMLTEAGALQNLNKSTVARTILVRVYTYAELGL